MTPMGTPTSAQASNKETPKVQSSASPTAPTSDKPITRASRNAQAKENVNAQKHEDLMIISSEESDATPEQPEAKRMKKEPKANVTPIRKRSASVKSSDVSRSSASSASSTSVGDRNTLRRLESSLKLIQNALLQQPSDVISVQACVSNLQIDINALSKVAAERLGTEKAIFQQGKEAFNKSAQLVQDYHGMSGQWRKSIEELCKKSEANASEIKELGKVVMEMKGVLMMIGSQIGTIIQQIPASNPPVPNSSRRSSLTSASQSDQQVDKITKICQLCSKRNHLIEECAGKFSWAEPRRLHAMKLDMCLACLKKGAGITKENGHVGCEQAELKCDECIGLSDAPRARNHHVAFCSKRYSEDNKVQMPKRAKGGNGTATAATNANLTPLGPRT